MTRKAHAIRFTISTIYVDSVSVGDSLIILDTLINMGNDTLTIFSTAGSSSIFAFNVNPNTSLPPADSLVFQVAFLPDTNKVYSGFITIASNDPFQPSVTVSLSGVCKGPEISVSSQSLSFSNTVIADTLTLPVTIFNTGRDPLTISSIASQTASYTVTPSSGTVAVGDSLVVSVLFIPVSNQKNIDTLTINSNALADPAITIAVTGNNLPPVIISLPDTVLNEGDVFSYTITANDSDSNVLTYTLLSPPVPPTGMTIDSQSGVLNWTIGMVDSGSHSVLVTVTDESAAAASQLFSISVASVINSPIIISAPDTVIHVDSLV